jgi:hypothetical protein
VKGTAVRFKRALLWSIPAVLAMSAVMVAAPGSATIAVSSTTPCAGTTAGSPPAAWDHVVLIMFENKPLKKIIGNTTDAPYINSIAKACAYSKATLSLSTTSLANYISLTSGHTGCDRADTDGVCTHELAITSNDDPRIWPQAPRSIFELLDAGSPDVAAAGIEWGENRPTNCSLVSDKGNNYTVTHTPFPYYTRTQSNACKQYAVGFPANPAGVQSARFNLVIPNKEHIMHKVPNTTIPQRIRNGDNWLKAYLPQLLDSATYQAGSTAILITWDEGNSSNFLVPLIAITPYTTPSGVSSVAYNHYSTLKGIQQMIGLTPLLGHAGDAGRSSIRDDTTFRLAP